MEFIENIYAWPARAAVAILAIMLVLLFALQLFPAASRKTGSETNKVVDLQKAFNADRFKEVLLSWSASGGNQNAVEIMKWENIIKLDLIFPVLYALALAFAYSAVRGNSSPNKLDLVLFALPFIAGVFDLIENGLHLYLLSGINTRFDVESAHFSPALVCTAATFAAAKYFLLCVSGFSIVCASIVSIVWAIAGYRSR